MGVKSVVIVEDEPETAEMLAEMMRLVGYEVFQSFGGLRAVELIAEKRPTAVLLDQMMPEIPGLEVLQSIRLDSRLRDIPVIMISAKNLPADIARGREAGAAFYLTKPVAFMELVSALEQVTT
jgi:two-component system phosphate regulon response regulator PhoB